MCVCVCACFILVCRHILKLYHAYEDILSYGHLPDPQNGKKAWIKLCCCVLIISSLWCLYICQWDAPWWLVDLIGGWGWCHSVVMCTHVGSMQEEGGGGGYEGKDCRDVAEEAVGLRSHWCVSLLAAGGGTWNTTRQLKQGCQNSFSPRGHKVLWWPSKSTF